MVRTLNLPELAPGKPLGSKTRKGIADLWMHAYLYVNLILSTNPIMRERLESVKLKLAEANEVLSPLLDPTYDNATPETAAISEELHALIVVGYKFVCTNPQCICVHQGVGLHFETDDIALAEKHSRENDSAMWIAKKSDVEIAHD